MKISEVSELKIGSKISIWFLADEYTKRTELGRYEITEIQGLIRVLLRDLDTNEIYDHTLKQLLKDTTQLTSESKL